MNMQEHLDTLRVVLCKPTRRVAAIHDRSPYWNREFIEELISSLEKKLLVCMALQEEFTPAEKFAFKTLNSAAGLDDTEKIRKLEEK